MSTLTDYLPGYSSTVAPPKAFTVSYEWNWDHNESWPRQAHGMPPESRYCCTGNGGKCCYWTVPAGANYVVFEMWGGGASGQGGCCCMQGYSGDGASYAVKSTAVQAGDTFTLCAAGSNCCRPEQSNYAGCNTYVMGTPTGLSCFCATACGGICTNCSFCHGYYGCYSCCMNCYNCSQQPNNVDFGISGIKGSAQRSYHCGDRGLQYIPVAPMAQSGPRLGPNGCCARGGDMFGSWPGGGGSAVQAQGGGCCCGSPGASGAIYVLYY